MFWCTMNRWGIKHVKGAINNAISRDACINSLSASLLLNIFLSFEVGIAHAIANFKWKENTSSLKN